MLISIAFCASSSILSLSTPADGENRALKDLPEGAISAFFDAHQPRWASRFCNLFLLCKIK
jgi:hypothetical protein